MNLSFESIGNRVGLTAEVVVALAVVLATLLLGSLARFIRIFALRVEPKKRYERLGSLLVWWGGLGLIILIVVGGPAAAAVAFAILSLLAIREYFFVLDKIVPDPVGRGVMLSLVPLGYFSAWWNDDFWFTASIPLGGSILIAAWLVASGKTQGYLASVGGLVWGSLVLVFFPAHGVRLLSLEPGRNPIGGTAGWFLYLIVLTEAFDIFQALWGRRYGKRRIAPSVSPKKSLEGLVGGFLSMLVLGIAIAPWLTPFAEPWLWQWQDRTLQIPYGGAIAACVLIAAAGLLGDLNISALKRDAGVKDSGDWLPGQGGILDRLDSLTFTAPVFYYFVRALTSP